MWGFFWYGCGVLTGIIFAAFHYNKQQQHEGGRLFVRYTIPPGQEDVTFDLVGDNFTDNQGRPTGAGDIDLSVENSNPAIVVGTLGPQLLSDDGQTVTAPLTLHFPTSPPMDLAAVVVKAKNRDTGDTVNAESADFTPSGPGEATIGRLTMNIPMTPDPEPVKPIV